MKKIFNVKKIVIAIIALFIFHVTLGYFISPVISSIIIDKLNEHGGTRISAGDINVWPITLSCTLRDLKIFDPDNKTERIIAIKKVAVSVSPLALLSKRLVFTRINVSGADINLKGEKDGSFNVHKLGRSQEPERKISVGKVVDWFKMKKDLFGRISHLLKKKASSKSIDEKIAEQKEAKKITREIDQLPKGRRVKFPTVRDGYVFEIQKLSIKNASVHITTDKNETIDIENAGISMRDIAFDPAKGTRCNMCNINGQFKKNGKSAGNFELMYAQSFKRDKQIIECGLTAKNIDLEATSFVYEESLPLGLTEGKLNIQSKTRLVNNELDSKNSIRLKNHYFVPKSGRKPAISFVPVTVLCDALNEVNPLVLKIHVGGTVEKPRFEGLQETVMKLIEPYIADVAKKVEEEGVSILEKFLKKQSGESAEGTEGGQSKTQDAIDTFKSLFGGDKE